MRLIFVTESQLKLLRFPFSLINLEEILKDLEITILNFILNNLGNIFKLNLAYCIREIITIVIPFIF